MKKIVTDSRANIRTEEEKAKLKAQLAAAPLGSQPATTA